MFKWRIYCTEISDQGWQELWSSIAPTECPNDVEHSVNLNSIQQLAKESEVLHLYVNKAVSTLFYMRIVKLRYVSTIQGSIRRIDLGIHCDGTTTSYNVQCYDQTNETQLAEETLTNTDAENNTQSIIISNAPIGEFNLEINVKTNNGTGNVYISEITIIAEQEN